MPPPAEGFAARLIAGPALRAQPDRRLVALVRSGYEVAFEEIVRRYGGQLTRYAGAIAGGHAEDVTQDAFSKALLALRRDGAEIELRAWLFRIVRNTALNELRDRPPSAEALADELVGDGNPAKVIERREELAELMRRLRELPEQQRAAIVMRELEGLGHEEIARALGLSGGGARQAIYRARRALRDGLGMLLPLPVLKGLLSGTVAPVEAVTGAAGMSGAAGAGVALKTATATFLLAGAIGAGVAIDHGHRDGPLTRGATARPVAVDAPARATQGVDGSPTLAAAAAPVSARRPGQSEAPGPSGADGGGSSVASPQPESGRGTSTGHDGGRGGAGGDGLGDRHGGGTAQSGAGTEERHSDDSGRGPSTPDDPSTGDSGGGSNDGPGNESGGGSGETDSGGAEEGVESDNGPDSSGSTSKSGDSSDSGGGDGFSVQTEPQLQEEAR